MNLECGISKISLGPNDTIIIKVPGIISDATRKKIKDSVLACVPLLTQIVILDGGMEIAVLSPERKAA